MKIAAVFAAAVVLSLGTGPALAQSSPSNQAQQKAAIAKLDFIRGVWVGPASGSNRDGSRYAVTQTERIGPMLDGELMVIEGRGYEADGSTGFNAFGVVSFNVETQKYEFRSYAQGYSGTFPFTVTDNGYEWEIPAGPGTVKFVATVEGETFREVGDFIMPGRPPMRTFEMTLTRRSDTDWPAADPVQP